MREVDKMAILNDLFGKSADYIINSEPKTGAEIINDATVNGLQEKIDYSRQNLNEFADSIRNLSAVGGDVLPYANQIVNNKLAWDGLQQALAPFLSKAELTDDDKNKMANIQGQQQQLSDANDLIRGFLGDRLGIFGQNITGQQGKIALLGNQIKLSDEINDAINGKYALDSDTYFEQQYDRYRQNGNSHRDATILAGRDARKYQTERMNYLDSSLYQYGLNDDGSLNPLGSRLSGKLAEENEILGSVYQTNFATPKDEWNEANKIAMAGLINDNAMQKLNQQAYFNQILENMRQQGRIARTTMEEEGRNARAEAERKSRENEGALNRENALHIASVKNSNGSGNNSKGKNAPDKNLNAIENLFDVAFANPTEENIAAYEKAVEEKGVYYSSDDYREMREFVDALKGLYYKKMGDDNNAAAHWSKVNPQILEELLPNENWDAYKK